MKTMRSTKYCCEARSQLKNIMNYSSNALLRSAAISYIPPIDCERVKNDLYWHTDLLQQWQSLLGSAEKKNESSSRTVDYASFIILAAYTANQLRQKLSLHRPLALTDANAHNIASLSSDISDNIIRDTANTLRVGMAIPEGPFLPLFVMVIHSLNIAVAEHWLTLSEDEDTTIDESGNGRCTNQNNMCKGVVFIPMETDEAPDRLKHIVNDSSPHLILVASGDDRKRMESALGEQDSVTQLADFIELLESAMTDVSRQQTNNIDHLSWIRQCEDDSGQKTIEDSSWDVARLVARGCAWLASSSPSGDILSSTSLPKAVNSSSSASSLSTIMSHIVYTSGTTGKPKGCISSLPSLQHYIRAKNIAHEINSTSNVMLASAVTFDPCFSDVLATLLANGTLCLAPRAMLYGHVDIGVDDIDEEGGRSYRGLTKLLRHLRVTHVLCTPTLWAMVEGDPPMNIPSLQVVALGGEPIPKSMRGRWARKRMNDEFDSTRSAFDRDYPRLFATYGVTEACVYQTCGEVIEESKVISGIVKPGQNVGLPLIGTAVCICRPLSEDNDDEKNVELEILEQEDESDPVLGEVVLSGKQLDAMSSYLNLPDLTRKVFVQSSEDSMDRTYYYRTGDMGYIDASAGHVYISGRIKGDGMVKINGIRIELSEIETSVIDDAVNDSRGLVVDCMAAVETSASSASDDEANQHKQLIAYCILSSSSIAQLGIEASYLKAGVIIPPSPLLSLLRARCDRRVRKGCMPSFFVLIDRLPLSPTGKRNRSALPPIEKCSMMSQSVDVDSVISLWHYGVAGPFVAEKICECLNLQPSQRSLVTTSSSFFILGGDSLAATRVTRGLYARHHNVNDSRNLGGGSGTLDGPFAAKFLLQAKTLGEYCDFLDSHSAFSRVEQQQEVSTMKPSEHSVDSDDSKQPDTLFESLIESITIGHTNISLALLDFVDPNIQSTNARLGKITDRKQQRSLFKSSPIHLACIRGDPILVRSLLEKGCKANQPDASGAFPIHLACSHLEGSTADSTEEDLNRRECVRILLEAGTPIAIKDGNKQTILHSAARSAHIQLMKFILQEWKVASNAPNGIKFKSHGKLGSIYDWHDRWYRTPVHWAILNKRIETLRVLLDGGCSASPPKPKQGVSKRSTSALVETPMEMCERLYGGNDEIGKEIRRLLQNAE